MTQASLVVQVAALGTWVLRVSLGKHLGALALRKSWVDGVCTCATHKFIAPPRIHTTPGTETTNSRPWVMRVSRPPVDFRGRSWGGATHDFRKALGQRRVLTASTAPGGSTGLAASAF